jgi:branched-subunit amino acid transport protein AzlD
MESAGSALVLSLGMALVIFFCRAFPFFFFRGDGEAAGTGGTAGNPRGGALLSFVEKVAPPVAMTVLAFNSVAGQIRTSPGEALPLLAASFFTGLVHIWRRNPLISIIGGTAVYVILERILELFKN